MPSIQEVMEMAEALQGVAVMPVPDRCVAVRNRNSQCRRCVDVCIAGAISVANNEVVVNNGACVGCGSCIAVCPTEALVSLDPLEEDLGEEIASAVGHAETMAVFACARMAARNLGDPEKYAVVPCLGRMDEAMLVGLAARGIGDIVLVDGTCSTCKYGAASPAIDATVDSACTLLESQEAPAIVVRLSEFPPEVLDQEDKARGMARRGFLTSAGKQAKDMAMTAAEKAIADKLNQDKAVKVKSLRERLGVGKRGSLPQFHPERHGQILDDLFNLREAADPAGLAEVIADRRFGTVAIDTQNCIGCGMCVMFCPTGALRYAEEEEPPEKIPNSPLVISAVTEHAEEDRGLRPVEFASSDCVQCRLCQDACMQHCITVTSEVEAAQLFDFEPIILHIKRPSAKPKLFDRRR